MKAPSFIAVRVAAALSAFAMAGAAPVASTGRLIVRCRFVDREQPQGYATAKIEAYAGQGWSYTTGGEMAVEHGQYLEYGTGIRGVATPVGDDMVTVDLTFSRTAPVGTAGERLVGGSTAHLVRDVHFGRATHVSLGDAAGTELDVTVDRR